MTLQAKLDKIDQIHQPVRCHYLPQTIVSCVECDSPWPCITHIALFPECGRVQRCPHDKEDTE